MVKLGKPISVFLSYASKDKSLLKKLESHLSSLKRPGLVSFWHRRQILAGTNWRESVDEELEKASLILFLVSPDFLASDYCYHMEMNRALQRHQTGEARVIPLL